MSAGIDYGMGVTNIDTETGIRFGIVSVNGLSSWVMGEAEPEYPITATTVCKHCELEFEGDCTLNEFKCPRCKETFTEYWDYLEPAGWNCTASDPDYSTEYSESLNAVIITKSPFYALCKFASPCFPGGGDLDSPDDEGIKAYCLGYDYFEDGDCPYTVYSVGTTNELIQKETITQ